MAYIMDFLSFMGENFFLVVVLCIEIILAVIIFIKFNSRNYYIKNKISGRETENTFLKEFNSQNDEICLVIRRKDKMPLYSAGDIENFLGVTLQDLQNDISLIDKNVKETSDGKNLLYHYNKWDGETDLSFEFMLKSEKWVIMHLRKCVDNKEYDLISFYNATAIHNTIEEYKTLLAKAEETSQSKTTFLSRMSHEIRTPMNGIIGMLTLAEGKLEPENPVLNYLKRADTLSKHLLSLINDILDMSRIEAGKVELEEKVFSLRDFGKSLYDMFAKELEERGINYEVNYEEMTADYVLGDELRISQVIINFLSNAVKFTKRGEVIVTFRQMMIHENTVDIMIRVHDTGIGMSPEFINKVFRPFEQEGVDKSTEYGGTGLGMAITDNLVRIMGGEIVVESIKGKGTDFSVFFHLPMAEKPVEYAAENKVEKETETNRHSFEGCRILMAEDNEINAMVAVELLNAMGADVDVAANGREAVDMFASHEENYYDFILMDVQMPVMDGRKATRIIRSMDRPDAEKILIFALSADAFVEDERLSAESGMNGHFSKPVNFNELEKKIGKFLHKKEQI